MEASMTKKRITDLDMKRNWLEAMTFYIIYLIIGVLISSGLGAVAGSLFSDSIQAGIRSGVVFAGIYTAFLYFQVYKKKKIQSKVIIVIGAVATIIGFFYGMLVSLIFVAALTTRENGKRTDEAEIDI
jgi:membrane protease YdiL (CAAX protease family)